MKTSEEELRNMILLLHAEIRYLRKSLFEHLGIDDSDRYKFPNELSDAIKEFDSKHHLLVKDFPHLLPTEEK